MRTGPCRRCGALAGPVVTNWGGQSGSLFLVQPGCLPRCRRMLMDRPSGGPGKARCLLLSRSGKRELVGPKGGLAGAVLRWAFGTLPDGCDACTGTLGGIWQRMASTRHTEQPSRCFLHGRLPTTLLSIHCNLFSIGIDPGSRVDSLSEPSRNVVFIAAQVHCVCSLENYRPQRLAGFADGQSSLTLSLQHGWQTAA